MKQLLFIGLVLIITFNCKESNEKNLSAFDRQMTANTHPGKKLMETNCYVCHSPALSHDDRIGPPMIAVKKHYLRKTTTKEEFKKAIQDWIDNPNENDARMRGAVRRFGVMPKQTFSEETIEQIADYMFDNAIEQPEWFEDHFKNYKKRDM